MSKPTTLTLQVNPSLGLPLYRQIMDQIRAQIAGGRLHAGEFLPSVRLVAERLQVNPMTVSKAYSLLQHEGVLAQVRGKGVVVAAPAGDDVRGRQEQLQPLLRAALDRAHELNLTRQQVLDVLQPLLKEIRQ
jgi:GntR family transcriptional regulator